MISAMLTGSGPIAIVDDDPVDIAIFESAYQKSGLNREAVKFDSGAELISYIDKAKAANMPVPALLLLDINMPCMSGFELLKKIRADESLDPQPYVVVLTGSLRKSDMKTTSRLGCNRFQEKFRNTQEYVNFLESIVEVEMTADT